MATPSPSQLIDYDPDYVPGEGQSGDETETYTSPSLMTEDVGFSLCSCQEGEKGIVLSGDMTAAENIARLFLTSTSASDISDGIQENLINKIKEITGQGEKTRFVVRTKRNLESQSLTPNTHDIIWRKLLEDGTEFEEYYDSFLFDAKVFLSSNKLLNWNLIKIIAFYKNAYEKIINAEKFDDSFKEKFNDSFKEKFRQILALYKMLFSYFSKLAVYIHYPLAIIDSDIVDLDKTIECTRNVQIDAMNANIMLEISKLYNTSLREQREKEQKTYYHPLQDLTKSILQTMYIFDISKENQTSSIRFAFNAEYRTILQVIAELVTVDLFVFTVDVLETNDNIEGEAVETKLNLLIEFLSGVIVSEHVPYYNLDELWALFTTPLYISYENSDNFKRIMNNKYDEYKKKNNTPPEASSKELKNPWFYNFLVKSTPLYTASLTTCALGYLGYSTASYSLFVTKGAISRGTIIARSLGSTSVTVSLGMLNEILKVMMGTIPIITRGVSLLAENLATKNKSLIFIYISSIWIAGEAFINSFGYDIVSEESEEIQSSLTTDVDIDFLGGKKIKDFIQVFLSSFDRDNKPAEIDKIYELLNKETFLQIIIQNTYYRKCSFEGDSVVSLVSTFSTLSKAYKDVFVYALIQSNAHFILDAYNIIKQKYDIINEYYSEWEDKNIGPYDDYDDYKESIYNIVLNSYIENGKTPQISDNLLGLFGIFEGYGDVLIDIKAAIDDTKATVMQSNSFKGTKRLFDITKRWFIRQAQPEAEKETESRVPEEIVDRDVIMYFGNIMKPYRKHIVSYKGDGYPVLETAFGRLKMKDDSKGLYVKGGERKWYLYHWGSRIQEKKRW